MGERGWVREKARGRGGEREREREREKEREREIAVPAAPGEAVWPDVLGTGVHAHRHVVQPPLLLRGVGGGGDEGKVE